MLTPCDAVRLQTATAAIKEDEPTACTPRKRDLQVPARELVASLRTPAHDVVLSEFRTRMKTAVSNTAQLAVEIPYGAAVLFAEASLPLQAGTDKENVNNGVVEVHVKMDAAVAAPLQPAA